MWTDCDCDCDCSCCCPPRVWVLCPAPPSPLRCSDSTANSASHFIVNVRIWSAHCAVAYIAIIIIMLRLIPHPIPTHTIPAIPTHHIRHRHPSLMLHYVLHPSITAHVSNIVEPFGGRVESAKLFWDADGQGFPHTPNILAHPSHIYIYIYLPVCVCVCRGCLASPSTREGINASLKCSDFIKNVAGISIRLDKNMNSKTAHWGITVSCTRVKLHEFTRQTDRQKHRHRHRLWLGNAEDVRWAVIGLAGIRLNIYGNLLHSELKSFKNVTDVALI